MVKVSSFHSIVNPQDPIPSFISKRTSITNEMVKYALPFPNVMNNFLCFYGSQTPLLPWNLN